MRDLNAGAIQQLVATSLAIALGGISAHAQYVRWDVGTIGDAHALAPPAARHVLRIDLGGRGAYLMAINRQNADPSNPGLVLMRSDDEGQHWTFYRRIDNTATQLRNKFNADVIAVGGDVALVYSYDYDLNDPSSDDALRKVFFQYWQYDGTNDWNLVTERTVWDPGTSGTMYERAEIARDSTGAYWVQAWHRANLAPGQYHDHTPEDLVARSSTITDASNPAFDFSNEQILVHTDWRAGGRLVALPNPLGNPQPGRLLMLWNDYSFAPSTTKFIYRTDSDPKTIWSLPTVAFPDDPYDGIYHGAAMSSVGDGGGNLHLVYKDTTELSKAWYRRYDFKTDTFGLRTLVDNSQADWALQLATTLFKGDLVVFDNHLVNSELAYPWRLCTSYPEPCVNLNRYETRMWRLSTGLGPNNFTSLGTENFFNGYPSSPETLQSLAPWLVYCYSQNPDAKGSPGHQICILPPY
jgi:hypothetical protein